MLENATLSSASKSPSFGSLLAGFASAAASEGGVDARLDELEEDVATISYEEALRKHARHRSVVGDQSKYAQEPLAVAEPKAVEPDGYGTQAPASIATEKIASPGTQDAPKKASVTVRLTEAECLQLHARASEAGLSISAYLRSCIFETESLRTQVKEALADIRAGAESKLALPANTSRPASPAWRTRFLGAWYRKKRAATD